MEFPYYHPELAGDQKMILDTVREFSLERVAPLAAEIDESSSIPADLLAELAELGLLGIPVPEENGGAGFDQTSYVLSLSELARGSASVAMHVLSQTTLFIEPLACSGLGGLAAEVAAQAVSGECLGGMAFGEGGGVTVIKSLQTTVRAEGDQYRIDGVKSFVNAGPDARWIIVVAHDDGACPTFLVESDAKGVVASPARPRLGMRGVQVCDFTFDGALVDEDQRVLLDREAIRGTVWRSMIGLAAIGAGILRSARDEAVRYAAERVQFGRPIGSFDAMRERIGRIEEQYAVAINLAVTGAGMIDAGRDVSQFVRVARNVVAEGVQEGADHAVQVFGGYGYSREYPVERLYRDARYLGVAFGGEEVVRDAAVGALLED